MPNASQKAHPQVLRRQCSEISLAACACNLQFNSDDKSKPPAEPAVLTLLFLILQVSDYHVLLYAVEYPDCAAIFYGVR